MADQVKNSKAPENPLGSEREDGALGFPLGDHAGLLFAPDVRPAGALGEEAVKAAEALAKADAADGGAVDSETAERRTRPASGKA